MTDYTEMKPLSLPRPTTLNVECPCCGAGIEYDPDEDDAGSFYAGQDWPVCDACEVLIDVPPVRVSAVNETYHSGRSERL